MGLGLVVLAQRTVGLRAGGVEVAQRRPAQIVGLPVGGKGALEGVLGGPVGIDRLLGRVLGNRDSVGHAVHRRGGREDKVAHAPLFQLLQKDQRARQVHIVVKLGPLHRLPDLDLAGEVDHRLEVMVLAEHLQKDPVADVALHERRPGRQRQRLAARQIVQDDDAMASLAGGADKVRSDKTDSSGDKDPHDFFL